MSANGGERTGADRAEGAGDGGEERRSQLPTLILVVIVVGGLVALNRLLPNIDLQQALQDISSKLGGFTYVLVGSAAFIETGAFVGPRASRARRWCSSAARSPDRARPRSC